MISSSSKVTNDLRVRRVRSIDGGTIASNSMGHDGGILVSRQLGLQHSYLVAKLVAIVNGRLQLRAEGRHGGRCTTTLGESILLK